jgi:GntR family transcriptional regulator
MQTSFYPMDLVTRGAQKLIGASDIPEGTVQYLAEAAGTAQAGYRDTILVRPPDVAEARFFKLPDDGRVAVIVISRIAYAEGGMPFRLTISVFPADRNQFVINSGEVPQDPA